MPGEIRWVSLNISYLEGLSGPAAAYAARCGVAALRKLAELSVCLSKSVTIRSAFRPRRGTANAEMSAN